MTNEFEDRVSAIRKVRGKAGRQFRSLPNVIGSAIGLKITEGQRKDEVALIAFVRRKIDPRYLTSEEIVPSEVDGVPTDVVPVNPVALQPARPAHPGSSIGHYDVGAGTFGLVTRDKTTNEECILSNNHVLANVNSGVIGDPILQPGLLDGGILLDDTLASLYKSIPLKLVSIQGSSEGVNVTIPEGTNLADAALALPLKSGDIDPEIIDIGRPQGLTRPTIGMDVQKSGRTTHHTTASIFATDVEIEVDYKGPSGFFTNQIGIFGSGFSLPGDSGSGILDMSGFACALLFAGDDNAGVTFANPLASVLTMLDQELVT